MLRLWVYRDAEDCRIWSTYDLLLGKGGSKLRHGGVEFGTKGSELRQVTVVHKMLVRIMILLLALENDDSYPSRSKSLHWKNSCLGDWRSEDYMRATDWLEDV